MAVAGRLACVASSTTATSKVFESNWAAPLVVAATMSALPIG